MRNLKLHNKILLIKWLWKFTQENQSLWKEIILHKYGPEGEWCTNKVTNTYGVDVWKSIRHDSQA